MRARTMALAIGTAAAVISTAAARFHARLVKAEPAIDATVKEMPTAVRLWFNEAPEPRVSSGSLLTADSALVAKLKFEATDDSLSIVSGVLGDVTPGEYIVQWRTVSKDGHAIRGKYKFTYAPTGGPYESRNR